mmetsp:Transcript_32009/g.56614  ORF Transcript_32009/g.56614 Transcript_32009/m.56614 type:complete len:187 (-) Transcript_32009:63-623(-)
MAIAASLHALASAALLCIAAHAQDSHGPQLMRSEPDGIANKDAVQWMREGVLLAASAKAHSFEANGVVHPEEPCGYIGCNSYTCAWASGGAIMKFVSGKVCTNAIPLGSNQGAFDVDNATAPDLGAKSNYKIETLRDCMHAVKKQLAICSGHFQLHMDSMTCACLPPDGACSEVEDQKVCRYKIKE